MTLVFLNLFFRTDIHSWLLFVCVYIRICICVHVYMYAWLHRERHTNGGEREIQKERERASERERESVCMSVRSSYVSVSAGSETALWGFKSHGPSRVLMMASICTLYLQYKSGTLSVENCSHAPVDVHCKCIL